MKIVNAVIVMVAIAFMSLAAAQQETPELTNTTEPLAGVQSISELMNTVREGSAARRAELEQREQRFRESRDNRAALLEAAVNQREQQEAEADRLRALYQQGEEELAELEDLLEQESRDLSNVFTVVTQVSGDALPMIQNSMVSAQYGNRLDLLEQLSSGESIPTADELRELWMLMLDEMVYSGEVARFTMPIITSGGVEEERQVTRIGTFSALANGEYLRFLPESGRLLALARQPVGLSAGSARAFENSTDDIAPVAIDPSRGSILYLIVQTPELGDRVRQGGLIGYVILGLGAVGLLLGLERLVVLGLASRRSQQATEPDSKLDHPITQIRNVARNPDYLADVDAMSAKLDEIVASAAHHLRRGLATLAIFAAVSPLLGLLGTVTGMIETFQVITLFGAGDPRLMSGGISQALITTQLGLAVAIPLLLVHSFLQGRANTMIAQLDETAADEFARNRSEEASHAA